MAILQSYARYFLAHARVRVSGAAADRRRRHAVPAAHLRLRVDVRGRRPPFLQVEPEALTLLTETGRCSTSRTCCGPATSPQLRAILDDPEASPNDRFVALELLKNACIAAGGILPSCQDTGTAIVKGKKGELVVTGGGDREAIARGIFQTYTEDNLRYSQMAPLTVYEEKNTGTNLPAEIEIESVDGDAYKLLFMAKGGGSANKSLLFQETKALLNPTSLMTLARREAAHARHRRVPAVPPRARHRRHVGRADAEDGEARVGALPRLAAGTGNELGRGFRDRRARAAGARAHAGVRHRRAVRRQVLLPRRARDPPAAPRRVVPGRARGVVLGRPSGARQDHRRRRVPRAARDRPREVPARGHRRPPRGRRGRAASTSPGRWRRSARRCRTTR